MITFRELIKPNSGASIARYTVEFDEYTKFCEKVKHDIKINTISNI